VLVLEPPTAEGPLTGFQEWLPTYGYAAVTALMAFGIVGLPFPDETILLYSGVLVSKGTFGWLPTIAAAVAGAWCGISLSFAIGRTVGIAAVRRHGHRFHVTPARLDRAHAWFERLGRWLLVVGYFVPGVRHMTALLAGTTGLPFAHFAPYAWAGGLVWCVTFVGLGYAAGREWETLSGQVHRILLLAAAAAVGAAVLGLAGRGLWRRRAARKRAGRRPAGPPRR